MVVRATKICLNCKIEFSLDYSVSSKRWKERKFCCKKCQLVYKGKENRKKLEIPVLNMSINLGMSNINIAKVLNISQWPVKEILRENNIIYDKHYLTRHPEKSHLFGKHQKEESKLKISKTKIKLGIHAGKNHWNWRVGISGDRERAMSTTKYKNWRKAVFERDDYTCQRCFKRGGNLEVHHKQPWRDYPELRFDLENGQTLCVECHKAVDKYRN